MGPLVKLELWNKMNEMMLVNVPQFHNMTSTHSLIIRLYLLVRRIKELVIQLCLYLSGFLGSFPLWDHVSQMGEFQYLDQINTNHQWSKLIHWRIQWKCKPFISVRANLGGGFTNTSWPLGSEDKEGTGESFRPLTFRFLGLIVSSSRLCVPEPDRCGAEPDQYQTSVI